MKLQCSVCSHPDRNEVDRAMLRGQTLREIEARFGLHRSSLDRHKVHIGKRIAQLVKTEENDATRKLLRDTEWLWAEAQQLVFDSRTAVKTQSVTVKETGAEGKLESRTEYREYRDLGAMAQALKVAHENRRLYGDATGVIGASAPNVNITLHMGLPPAAAASAVLSTVPAIEVPSESVQQLPAQADPDPDSSE